MPTFVRKGKKWRADEYGNFFDEYDVPVHPDSLEPLNKVFMCEAEGCNKSFTSRIALAGHNRTHFKKEVVK